MTQDERHRVETPRGRVDIIPPGQTRAAYRRDGRIRLARVGPLGAALIAIAGVGVFVALIMFLASALAVLFGIGALAAGAAYLARLVGRR